MSVGIPLMSCMSVWPLENSKIALVNVVGAAWHSVAWHCITLHHPALHIIAMGNDTCMTIDGYNGTTGWNFL